MTKEQAVEHVRWIVASWNEQWGGDFNAVVDRILSVDAQARDDERELCAKILEKFAHAQGIEIALEGVIAEIRSTT